MFVSGPSVVLLLEPSSLSAMVVVAVRCRFVHVASNKKSFSKVKKKVKKSYPAAAITLAIAVLTRYVAVADGGDDVGVSIVINIK